MCPCRTSPTRISKGPVEKARPLWTWTVWRSVQRGPKRDIISWMKSSVQGPDGMAATVAGGWSLVVGLLSVMLPLAPPPPPPAALLLEGVAGVPALVCEEGGLVVMTR